MHKQRRNNAQQNTYTQQPPPKRDQAWCKKNDGLKKKKWDRGQKYEKA